MSLCRDLREDQPQLKFPLYEFLTAVAEAEPASTSEIESAVGSSYPTAIKKLKELQVLGAVKSTRVGAAHQWRLDPSSLEKSGESGAVYDQETVACLLIETIDSIACDLSQYELLANEMPTRYQQWLAGRNMDDSHRAREVLSRACLFDFFLKSAIYALYEPEHKEMGALSVEADFAARFAEAERVTQNKGFELSVPGELIVELDQSEVRTVLALRGVLNSTSHPAETLSMVYERLFVQDARRDLGQFATPNYISEILAKWAINDADDTILDPGVGAGMLSSAAVMEKVHRGANKPLQDIRANDIDELGVSMAAVSLKLVDGPGSPVLKRGNFLEFDARDWIENEDLQNQSVDAVVANPPYSRSQAMETAVKSQANRIVSDETGVDFHGKSPLYVYFLAHAAQFVADGGRLAFIIPSGFMETEFGVP